MQHYTRSITCPVCGQQAVLAYARRGRADEAIDPNDVGLTCMSGCRPTIEQLAPILDLARN